VAESDSGITDMVFPITVHGMFSLTHSIDTRLRSL
jgi:hypothetical protein